MICLFPVWILYCLRSGACSGYCAWNRLRTSLRLKPYNSENLRALSVERGINALSSTENERWRLQSLLLLSSPHSVPSRPIPTPVVVVLGSLVMLGITVADFGLGLVTVWPEVVSCGRVMVRADVRGSLSSWDGFCSRKSSCSVCVAASFITISTSSSLSNSSLSHSSSSAPLKFFPVYFARLSAV